MSTESKTRPYRKRRRAELEDETRRRIAAAAADLHGTVGPARTTISAVADRAGVQRATVYRHFPDEESLFAACSAHWEALHAPPDPTAWAEIADAGERLARALGELYPWYAENERMLANIRRDVALVPAMRDAVSGFDHYYEAAAEILVRGRPERGGRRRRVRAAIGHALAFDTWRSLVRDQGLAPEDAIELMTGLVAAA